MSFDKCTHLCDQVSIKRDFTTIAQSSLTPSQFPPPETTTVTIFFILWFTFFMVHVYISLLPAFLYFHPSVKPDIPPPPQTTFTPLSWASSFPVLNAINGLLSISSFMRLILHINTRMVLSTTLMMTVLHSASSVDPYCLYVRLKAPRGPGPCFLLSTHPWYLTRSRACGR